VLAVPLLLAALHGHEGVCQHQQVSLSTILVCYRHGSHSSPVNLSIRGSSSGLRLCLCCLHRLSLRLLLLLDCPLLLCSW
jgi:hypothetical protein